MKKIPTIFVKVPGATKREGMITTEEPRSDLPEVFGGQCVARRKFDGTSCMVRGGKLFKRFDCKRGRQVPEGFEPCQEPDPNTGHWPGWVPVGPNDRWHLEAFTDTETGVISILDAGGLTTVEYGNVAERMLYLENITADLEGKGLRLAYRHRECKDDGVTLESYQLWIPK